MARHDVGKLNVGAQFRHLAASFDAVVAGESTRSARGVGWGATLGDDKVDLVAPNQGRLRGRPPSVATAITGLPQQHLASVTMEVESMSVWKL